MIRKVMSGCWLAAILGLLAGCGDKLQPAGGKVLVDGVPVKEGTIMFYPTSKGRPATARIREDGSFILSFERPGDGLPVGEYRVAIVADIWREGRKTAAQEYDEKNLKRQGIEDTSTNAGGILIHVVPTEYNDISTTPLTQTVTRSSDPQHFVFDIPSKKKPGTPPAVRDDTFAAARAPALHGRPSVVVQFGDVWPELLGPPEANCTTTWTLEELLMNAGV